MPGSRYLRDTDYLRWLGPSPGWLHDNPASHPLNALNTVARGILCG